jgi:hypothetical protein
MQSSLFLACPRSGENQSFHEHRQRGRHDMDGLNGNALRGHRAREKAFSRKLFFLIAPVFGSLYGPLPHLIPVRTALVASLFV